MHTTPQEMARSGPGSVSGWFEWALDDLRGLVPGEEFRQRQFCELACASAVYLQVSGHNAVGSLVLLYRFRRSWGLIT